MVGPHSVGLGDGDFWDLSLPQVDAMRENADVFQAVVGGVRVWVITGHDDAMRALADPRLSKDSAAIGVAMAGQRAQNGDAAGWYARQMLLYRDGVDVERVRALLSPVFLRSRIAALRPRVEDTTTGLLDRLAVDRPVDLVAGLAMPLALAATFDVLSVPTGDRVRLHEWIAMVEAGQTDAVANLTAYFTDLVEVLRATPHAGVLSALLHAPDPRQRPTVDEVLDIAYLMMVGAYGTAHMIANGLFRLLTEPGAWDELAGAPWLLPTAVLELLRFDSPLRMATHRTALAPVEYGGWAIPAGEIVLVWLQAANRDSRRCPHADRLELGRSSTHLAFGHGPHYCIGAPFARMQAEVVLGAVTSRFPEAHLDTHARVRHVPNLLLNGLSALPVVLRPKVAALSH